MLPWKFLLLHNVFVRYTGIGLNKTQENRFIINIIQSCYEVLDREKWPTLTYCYFYHIRCCNGLLVYIKQFNRIMRKDTDAFRIEWGGKNMWMTGNNTYKAYPVCLIFFGGRGVGTFAKLDSVWHPDYPLFELPFSFSTDISGMQWKIRLTDHSGAYLLMQVYILNHSSIKTTLLKKINKLKKKYIKVQICINHQHWFILHMQQACNLAATLKWRWVSVEYVLHDEPVNIWFV